MCEHIGSAVALLLLLCVIITAAISITISY